MPLACSKCNSTSIMAIYDRNLDCTVAWKCEACGHQWNRDVGEIIAVADEAAFSEPKPKAEEQK